MYLKSQKLALVYTQCDKLAAFVQKFKYTNVRNHSTNMISVREKYKFFILKQRKFEFSRAFGICMINFGQNYQNHSKIYFTARKFKVSSIFTENTTWLEIGHYSHYTLNQS